MNRFQCRVAIVVSLLAPATGALAQPSSPAGRIKVASGSVFVVRQGQAMPAQIGQLVFEGDGLRTGADGRVGVTLNDDTRVRRAWQRDSPRSVSVFAGGRPARIR